MAPPDCRAVHPNSHTHTHTHIRLRQGHAAAAAASGTDFSSWSEPQLRAFLDRRGGDHDDCRTHAQLTERAAELEVNTGPAGRPPADSGGEDADDGVGEDAGGKREAAKEEEEEEYDPLDAFMAGVDAEVEKGGPSGRPRPRADLACDETPDGSDFLALKAARGGGAAVPPPGHG
eukprot:199965-Chlamydomonas_euryale.AAC.1